MTNDVMSRLCQLVTRPDRPTYNVGDWEAVESDLGLCLPEDYKRLIETFGQGIFHGHCHCSGLLITSYLGPAAAVAQAEGFGAILRELRELVPMPYGIYPDKPGLLGFGSYGDKDMIAWETTGKPEEWPIVYYDPETGFDEIHGWGTLGFVISVLEETSPLHDYGVIQKGDMEGPHTFGPQP